MRFFLEGGCRALLPAAAAPAAAAAVAAAAAGVDPARAERASCFKRPFSFRSCRLSLGLSRPLSFPVDISILSGRQKKKKPNAVNPATQRKPSSKESQDDPYLPGCVASSASLTRPRNVDENRRLCVGAVSQHRCRDARLRLHVVLHRLHVHFAHLYLA